MFINLLQLFANETTLTLPVSNLFNLQYYVTLGIGSPPQPMPFILDTGSTVLWAPLSSTPTHKSAKFNSSRSSTYNVTSQRFQITYGRGYCQGFLGWESVWVGGMQAKHTEMLFVDYDQDLEGMYPSGIFGLSNDPNYKNIFQILYQQKLIESPLFAVVLKDSFSDSRLYYGALPQSILVNATFVPATRRYYWTILLTDFFAGDSLISKGVEGLIDTGSSYLIFPQKFRQGIMNQLKWCLQSGNSILCKCTDSLPSLRFNTGSVLFQLKPKDYLIQRTTQICEAAIQFDIQMSFVILGDVFLRVYPVIFDKQKNQLGFWTPQKARLVGGEFSIFQLIILLISAGGLYACSMVYSDLVQAREQFQNRPSFEINGNRLN